MDNACLPHEVTDDSRTFLNYLLLCSVTPNANLLFSPVSLIQYIYIIYKFNPFSMISLPIFSP